MSSILSELKLNSDLFTGKRILVIGDIAFDHSYYCRTSQKGFHAHHANELIFDIIPGGDDYGEVGSACNISLFAKSLKADSFLFTVIGKDPEGQRVKEILKKDQIPNKPIEIPGLQTVTRLRFYIFNDILSSYELSYRMDKEPDYEFSYKSVISYIQKSRKFTELLQNKIENCDLIILNDTEKGFLSKEFIDMISQFVDLENEKRKKEHFPKIVTIVDPKNNWGKFQSLSDAIIKPNIKETIKELNLDPKELVNKLDINSFLQLIAEKLYEKYNCSVQNYVITLGKDGAAFVNFSENNQNVYWFPAFNLENEKDENKKGNMSAHCGDVFDTALGLALTLENCDIFSAIQFANCAGFLQYSKGNGKKIKLQDLLQTEDLEYQQKNSNYIKIS
ncbi:MAG: hypothetical protein Q8940_11495 [Bacteroidota bacterium]|nr:hypothetical protein [Bacteroidota bacterium]